MKLPTVALVGRPNVGKSTVFNKLVGKKISIIEDTPGVTRDRIYSEAFYLDYRFNLIDTGGIDVSKELFNEEIKIQAMIAIDEADVIVFIVDGKEELTQNDYIIRDMLKKANKKVIVAINKIDTKEGKENVYNFYSLGFDNYVEISGEHNVGFIELLDLITKEFPKSNESEKDYRLKFSVIGRPNVGKSSLINAILNEDRVIVASVAGTTRDAIDTPFNYRDQEIVAIDTAGIRKQGKIYENIEKYSLIRSLKAIDRSDISVLVINVDEGIIEHDKHIASYALEKGKGIIIAVNKWDLIEDKDIKKYTELIRAEFQFIPYAPIIFISSLYHKNIDKVMQEVLKVYENTKKRVQTSLLNDVISESYLLKLPPSYKGKRLKIYFTSQESTNPPKFVFQVNNKNLVHFSYYRYLENRIRENFDFEGTPIELVFKNRGEE